MVQQRRDSLRLGVIVHSMPKDHMKLDQLAAASGQDPEAQPEAGQSAVTREGHGGILRKVARAVNAPHCVDDPFAGVLHLLPRRA